MKLKYLSLIPNFFIQNEKYIDKGWNFAIMKKILSDEINQLFVEKKQEEKEELLEFLNNEYINNTNRIGFTTR